MHENNSVDITRESNSLNEDMSPRLKKILWICALAVWSLVTFEYKQASDVRNDPNYAGLFRAFQENDTMDWAPIWEAGPGRRYGPSSITAHLIQKREKLMKTLCPYWYATWSDDWNTVFGSRRNDTIICPYATPSKEMINWMHNAPELLKAWKTFKKTNHEYLALLQRMKETSNASPKVGPILQKREKLLATHCEWHYGEWYQNWKEVEYTKTNGKNQIIRDSNRNPVKVKKFDWIISDTTICMLRSKKNK